MRKFASWLAALSVCASSGASAAGIDGICADCTPQKVASCGGFLEGATVSPSGEVYVMDLSGDRILEIRGGKCVEKGKAGGGPNGAKFRKDGTLFITGRQGLVSFDPATGTRATVVDSFEGKPFGGLNDLSIAPDGGIYFTEVGGSSLFNPVGRVFYLAPGAKEAKILAQGLAFPNGIAVAPGGQTVLVSEFAAKRVISIPSASANGGIKLAYVYAITPIGVGADGMIVDDKGRLWTAQIGSGTILVFGDDSRILGEIRLPKQAGRNVTNLVIAGGYLYITEASKGEVWRVKLTV